MKITIAFFIAIIFVFQSFAQPLKVSDNKRFLVKEDGSPFFWLADTGWEMFHRLDQNDIDYYLRNRASKGFTVIQAVILSEIDGLTTPNEEGNLPLHELDPTRPNEAYFELVDFAVQKAEAYGIYLALLPTWGSHAEDKAHPVFENLAIFDINNAKTYGRFLGDRYKSNWNIIWVLGGDRDGDATGSTAIWDSMAEGINQGSNNRHLLTYHPRGQETSSSWFQASKWLDFNMIQTGHLQPGFPVYDWITRDYIKTPTKPVLNGEPAYEDIGYMFKPINGRYDDYHVRQNAYWSVFAGAFGHTYGNGNIWQMYKEKYEPIIYARIPWDQALEQPGAAQMQYLRNLMLSRPFTTRIPDQSILLDENPSHSSYHIRVTRDGTVGNNDATYLMAYLPFVSRFSIDTRVISSNQLKIWWYNPRTGDVVPAGIQENTGEFNHGIWSDFLRKEQGGPDWVIIIDDATKNYAPPGRSMY